MNSSFIVITFFLVSVVCDRWGLLHFSRNEQKFHECFLNHFDADQYNVFQSEYLYSHITYSFRGRTFTKDSFDSTVANVIWDLQLENIRIPEDEFEQKIKKALLHCTDEGIDLSNNPSKIEVNSKLNLQTLPYFSDESADDSHLLDFILVNWPYIRESMISLPNRRALLRRYANGALNVLECTYSYKNLYLYPGSSFNRKDLNIKLRLNWMRRAQIFFDGRNLLVPYINHMYTKDLNTPHTSGNTKMFIDRSTENFEDRNPQTSESNIDKVLYIHPIVNALAYDLFNIYTLYNHEGMTKANYYFEYHFDQFFRILFLFVELQAHGIVTDEDDFYEGSIPYEKVPEYIQAIIYNDTIYRQYLIDKREEELRFCPTENPYKQNLERSSRVREIDLILLFWIRIRSQAEATITSTTTTSTIFTDTISTTPEYYESKKGKGLINKGHTGKCFIKTGQVSADMSCEFPNSRSFRASTSTQNQQQDLKMDDKLFGYGIFIENDSKHLLLDYYLKASPFQINELTFNV